jgi:hypothetical protein
VHAAKRVETATAPLRAPNAKATAALSDDDSDISDVSSVNTDDLSSDDDNDSATKASGGAKPSAARKKVSKKSKSSKVGEVPRKKSAATPKRQAEVTPDTTRRSKKRRQVASVAVDVAMDDDAPVAAAVTPGTTRRSKKRRQVANIAADVAMDDAPVADPVWDNVTWFSTVEVGTKLQAMDGPEWYDARIANLDQKGQRAEIKYDGWNKKYNRWFAAGNPEVRIARVVSK